MPAICPTSRSTTSSARYLWWGFAALPLFLLAACAKPVPDLAALNEKSRSILQLESCQYLYHDIVYQGKLEKLLGMLTTKDTRVLFSLDIRVTAGIDLQATQAISLKSLPANAAGLPGLQVLLPPARVTGADADENTIHQYFLYEYGISGNERVNWLDYQDEILRSKERAISDAIKRGLLDTAWENAADSLKSFFRLAGFGEVRVEKAGGQA